MCGRYRRSSHPAANQAFNLGDADPSLWLARDTQAAPTETVPVVVAQDGARRVMAMRWGWKVSWSPRPLINARAETLEVKSTFVTAFRSRRCLLPAAGFYEWATVGKKKQPYIFQFTSGAPLALGGIWRPTDGLPEVLIITTGANPLVAPIHDRMPVIIAAQDYTAWLEAPDPAAASALMVPYPAEQMSSEAVVL